MSTKNKHLDRNKIQCAQSKIEIEIQRKRKLDSDLKILNLNKTNSRSMCLMESEGSQAVADVAYRQKTKIKQRLLKMSVKWRHW